MPHSGHSHRALRALVKAGYSSTRSRRAVIDVIAREPGGVTAAGILERARQAHPRLGLVTVYRTLEVLSSLGLVRRIHLEDGCHTYALSHCSHGHHIICERCHHAVEFEGCELHQLMARVSQQTGYRVTDHWLEMFGLCPRCEAQNAVAAADLRSGGDASLQA